MTKKIKLIFIAIQLSAMHGAGRVNLLTRSRCSDTLDPYLSTISTNYKYKLSFVVTLHIFIRANFIRKMILKPTKKWVQTKNKLMQGRFNMLFPLNIAKYK